MDSSDFYPISPIPLGEMENFFLKTRGIVSLTPSNFFVVVALKLEKLQRFQFFGVFFKTGVILDRRLYQVRRGLYKGTESSKNFKKNKKYRELHDNIM